MSYNNFDKGVIKYEENADRNTNEQESPDTSIDMDLVEKEEAVRQRQTMNSDSKKFVCVDLDDSIGPTPLKNDETSVDVRQLDKSEVKTSVTNVKQKGFTVLGVYDNLFGAAPPNQGGQWQQGRFWGQTQQQPQQPMWNQYAPGQGPGPSPGPTQGPMPGQMPMGYGGYGGGFEPRGDLLTYDPRSRNSFVALVMSIVFCMLIATAGFIAFVLLMPDVKLFFLRSGLLTFIPAMIGLLIVNYAMICSPCARRPPCNIIMLIIATAAMSVIAAKVSTHYRTEIILYAVIATGAVVFVCILLACSKFDFTSWLLYVVVIATGFSVVVMIVLITMMVTGTLMKPLLITILIIGTIIQVVVEAKITNTSIYDLQNNMITDEYDEFNSEHQRNIN